MKHNNKDYISYTKEYNDFISLGFGKWTDLKPSELGLKWEIIHNLPLQAYNYEYKDSVPLSLCTILIKPKLIEQSVDIVMPSFNIRNGYPIEITKTDVIVHSKKDLFNAVMNTKKGRLSLYLSGAYSNTIDHILKDIVQKYEKLVIEDLEQEIKKRETELESISILQLNKLV